MSGATTSDLSPPNPPEPVAPAPVPSSGTRRADAIRATEIALGLAVVGVSIVVLANPFESTSGLIALLAAALAIDALRLLVLGGTPRAWWRRIEGSLHQTLAWTRRMGRIGIAVVTVAVVVVVLDLPQARQLTLLYLLAFCVVALSLDRIAHAVGRSTPRWARVSSGGAGAIAILLVVLAVAAPAIGLSAFAVLLAVSLLLSGIQSIVSGLRPTDPRQLVLLEVVLFSLLYGLVLINWIDLFGKTVPAYGIWLILTYFAPFWVMLVYEGFSEWPLALSLGLLVSLANDVGYYFVGNLLFGFHQDLSRWILGQLGFYGGQMVTIFQAGAFALPISSAMMGASIYGRAAVVGLGLYYWWRHPTRIVARLTSPAPMPP